MRSRAYLQRWGYRGAWGVLCGGLAVFLLTAAGPAGGNQAPEEPAAPLTIRWHGQSFFTVTTSRGIRIAFDPHAIAHFGRGPERVDFVLISHPHNDHDQIGIFEPPPKESDVYRGVVEPRPGRQEWKSYDERRGAIRFRTVATFHDALNGLQRGKNTVWIVHADGLTLCHLGDLGHELSDEQLKAIGPVDVLMVPIGGIYTLNGEQAAEVVRQIRPRLYILPMHYGVPGYDDLLGPEEFLSYFKEDEKEKRLHTNELVVRATDKLPKAKVLLLGWKAPERKEKPEK
jgi:L-ascorbate metabolism protein UlaG (beta-lactamase superfamily)